MVEPTTESDPDWRQKGEYAPGQVLLDRYTVESMLGRGGMGVVYLVRDQKTDTRIALKTITPKYANNKRAIVRFMREARAVRKLEHPAIVKFFDAGRLDDNFYFTMERVKGESVRKMLRDRKRFGLGSTIRILYLLCDALATAHTVSVHRDISPGNVMVTSNKTIKLLDFGLAKLIEPDEPVKSSAFKAITQKGVLLGKRWYIAPEQREDASTVDIRADIYSVGVMFYEMLAGEIPVGYEAVTDRCPELPEACNEILRKTLAEAPDDRYSNAAEVARALLELHKASQAKSTSE